MWSGESGFSVSVSFRLSPGFMSVTGFYVTGFYRVLSGFYRVFGRETTPNICEGLAGPEVIGGNFVVPKLHVPKLPGSQSNLLRDVYCHRIKAPRRLDCLQ
jgi:hypothetical protein